MPSNLDQDLLVQHIKKIPETLGNLPIRYLLTNGKVEKQLKFFVGAAWENVKLKRAYVMDKRFNNRELDLLAFEDGKPKFWFEAKCSFRNDHPNVESSARDAIRQVELINSNLQNDISQSDGYIVHFILSLPEKSDKLLSDDAQKKYAKLRNKKLGYQLGDLVKFYTKNLNGQHEYCCQVPLLFSAPDTDVVIVKLKKLPRP